jgi:CheY-like chemotaxis protein
MTKLLENLDMAKFFGKEHAHPAITVATNQREADEVVSSANKGGGECFDLIILDLKYPSRDGSIDMDGFAGMKWLPELRKLQPTSAIAIQTAYPFQEDLEDAVAAIRDHQLVEFIPKSINWQKTELRLANAWKTQYVRLDKRSTQTGNQDASPRTMTPIRVLHLSDLHFTDITLVEPQLQWLLEDLAQFDAGLDGFEFIVISGDFTNKGSAAGFDTACRFVSKLAAALQVSTERCVIVPGNHDVLDIREAYEWRESALGIPDDSWVRQGEIVLARNDAVYKLRLQEFSDRFHQVLLGRPFPGDPVLQGSALPFWDLGIQFIALNSSWQIDQFHRRRAGVHPGAIARVIQQARKQEAEARREGFLAHGLPVFRIAVWHHAVAGPEQIENCDFLGHLQNLGVRLALHGDAHEMRRELVAYWRAQNIHVVGAGSFGALGHALPPATPRLYNVLQISRDFRQVRVHTRCQPKPNGAWKGWYEWPDPNGGPGALPYYDVNF